MLFRSPHKLLHKIKKEQKGGFTVSITEQIQKNLGKKFSGNLALNKEVLRWKKSLTEVNKKLGSGKKKEE